MAKQQEAMARNSEWVRENFEAVQSRLPGAGNGIGALRQDAFQEFERLGFPSTKQEEWKYTNVSPIAMTSFSSAPEDVELDADILAPVKNAVPEATMMVFVNGIWSPTLSDIGQLDEGVQLFSLRSLLDGQVDDTAARDRVREALGSLADFKQQSFAALNTAFLNDGAIVLLKKNVVATKPIQLVFVSTASEQPFVVHPRVLILAESGSQASVVEWYLGESEATYFTSAVTEAIVAENAVIQHHRIQVESENSYHVSSVDVSQSRNSSFATHSFSFGGKLVRNEVNPTLDGEGIHTTMNGLSVLTDEQHVDNHTVIDHAKPHCESYEWYKGIYAHKSRGVFNGTIIVRPDAQKTNAFQSNQSLLLSSDATVDTKPQLKIWADDVKCSHGATIGQLDEDALFYLRSRGINKTEAYHLLIQAFAGDIISQVTLESLKEYLGTKLLEKLTAAYA